MFLANKTKKITGKIILRSYSNKSKEFNHLSILECIILYPIKFTKAFICNLIKKN